MQHNQKPTLETRTAVKTEQELNNCAMYGAWAFSHQEKSYNGLIGVHRAKNITTQLRRLTRYG
jgi:hypothetical protein